jgi:hypothetical protein
VTVDLGLPLLQDSLRTKGIAGTLRRAWSLARSTGRRHALERDSREFDRRHHVETAKWVRRHELDTESANKIHAVRYEPSREETFAAALSALDVDLREFTFVDYGSGKGRALLLAADYPFRRIVGVEFVASLDRIAQRNIATLGHAASRVQTHVLDAAAFDPPAGPLVAYLFNPFAPEVFRCVLERIDASLAVEPRPVYMILTEAPRLAGVLQDAGRTPVAGRIEGHIAVFRLDG